MVQRFTLLLLFIWSCLFSYSQNIGELFEKGRYKEVIELTSYTSYSDIENFSYRINSFSRMNFQTEHFEAISQLRKNKSNCDQIIYNTHLSKYYQQMMFIDSCLYHADRAMSLYREKGCKDSSIISFLYRQYANAMRNGGIYFEVIENAPRNYQTFDERNEFLKSYFDTALYYAQNDNQRADIYRKIGTMYSDGVLGVRTDPKKISFSVNSINYLRRSIALEKSPADKAMAQALIGLNYFYIESHRKAEVSLQSALQLTREDSRIIYPNQFITISDWRGENLEEMYERDKNVDLLNLANETYSRAFKVWSGYYRGRLVHDAYHNSSINRLVANHLKLFKVTDDSLHLFKAFEFIELSKYPDFGKTKNTIHELQKMLDEKTAFVNYTSLNRPNRHIAFVITKDDFHYLETKTEAFLDISKLSKLYNFTDINSFKYWSYRYYQSYFEKVDSILHKGDIENLIISNSDWLSMLNLDVIISDATGSKWQDLNYLFKRYNISYALSASAYINSFNKSQETNSPNLGITLGSYTKEANLRFSKKLKSRLKESYISEELDLLSNIKSSSVALLFSHGESNYINRNAHIKTSSNDSISASEIEKMRLKNDLVILTACNTNASQQYYSEGAIGNFNVAFRSAGASSVLTTSWAIDDKANAFIIEQFVKYLSEGEEKNAALWKAKKDYWNQCVLDEEFSPIYWAPYILTGNNEPVKIKKRKNETNAEWSWWWLTLLIVPLLILFKRRFS